MFPTFARQFPALETHPGGRKYALTKGEHCSRYLNGLILGKTSQLSRGAWEEMQARIGEYRAYYTGEIFEEKVPLEQATDDAPLM